MLSPDISLLLNTNIQVSSMVLTSTQLRQAIAQPSARKILSQYYPANTRIEENDLSVRAISRAIAESQQRLYGVDVSPTKYKDRVRRAIAGQSLTPDTVHLFADAFEFDDETVDRLLSQLSHENALSSTALTYLHEFPQASVNHAFLDISPTGRGTTELSINCTISALELGSSSFILFVPFTVGEAYKVQGCTATRVSAEGQWLFELDEPLAPLSNALLTMCFEVDTEQEGGSHLMLLPFWGKYNAIAIRVNSGSDTGEVAIETQGMGATESVQISDGVCNSGVYSRYFPAVENETLKIFW